MKKNASFFLIILVLVLTIGCFGGYTKMLTTNKIYEPTDPDKIEFYYSKIPKREYEEIAFVFADNYIDLKKTAAKIGANAVLQIRFNKGYDGIAVRWK